ncbi:hypothetical protein HDU82_004299 [Entophlyctis luteolus]|nr:hypothetical protein HDU82_004299 [Entophlyctis luteolus]
MDDAELLAESARAKATGDTDETGADLRELEEGEEGERAGAAEDEDDSDDDVEIVMDTEIPKPAPSQPITIKPAATATDGVNNSASAGSTGAANGQAGASNTKGPGGLDINLVGQIDGTDLFDVDVDGIEDKPWRRPGADITDYFNFGFNEVSWRAYCNKQKSLREEALMQKRIHVFDNADQSADQQMFGMFGMQQQQKYQRMPQQPQFNPMMNVMQMQMMQQQQMMQQPQQRSGMMPPPMVAPPGLPGMGPPGLSGMNPPPGMDLNAFGKRPREQDEPVIKVLAGGEGVDDTPPGTEVGRSDSQTSGPPGRYPGPPGGNFSGQQAGFNQQQYRQQPPPSSQSPHPQAMSNQRGMPPPLPSSSGGPPPMRGPPPRGRYGDGGYRGGPPPPMDRDGYYDRRDHYRDTILHSRTPETGTGGIAAPVLGLVDDAGLRKWQEVAAHALRAKWRMDQLLRLCCACVASLLDPAAADAQKQPQQPQAPVVVAPPAPQPDATPFLVAGDRHQPHQPPPERHQLQPAPTSAELASISSAIARLWNLDTNRLSLDLNIQARTYVSAQDDHAADPLFAALSLDSVKHHSPINEAFIALLRNYTAEAGIPEHQSDARTRQEHAFVALVCDTPVMRYVRAYCSAKGVDSCADWAAFRALVHAVWFTPYKRVVRNDSCAFEHTFVGERRSAAAVGGGDAVIGFHNWITFLVEEKARRADYRGYIPPKSAAKNSRAAHPTGKEPVMSLQLSWNGDVKPVSTFLMGVSPEYEMALYTLVFLCSQEDAEPVHCEIDGIACEIVLHQFRNHSGRQIGSAYVSMI